MMVIMFAVHVFQEWNILIQIGVKQSPLDVTILYLLYGEIIAITVNLDTISTMISWHARQLQNVQTAGIKLMLLLNIATLNVLNMNIMIFGKFMIVWIVILQWKIVTNVILIIVLIG